MFDKEAEMCISESSAMFMLGTVEMNCPTQDDKLQYLTIEVPAGAAPVQAGQFYMLRSAGSAQLLGRPISVSAYQESGASVFLGFLILERGAGTAELCRLHKGDLVEVLGPLGNGFPWPELEQARVCLASGGVGLGPIRNLALALVEAGHTCYWYAGFKGKSFGLDIIQTAEAAKRLHISWISENPSFDEPRPAGRIDAILTAEELKDQQYDVIYACGPEPMLAYVQRICREVDAPLWLSMENRMACGVGACLGCVVRTTEGNRRCCKDGPVFDGRSLIFDENVGVGLTNQKNDAVNVSADGLTSLTDGVAETAVNDLTSRANNAVKVPASPIDKSHPDPNKASPTPDELPFRDPNDPDLSVEIAGIKFQNPVIAASGTFGYGTEYANITDVRRLGGICSKGLTLEPRAGNRGTRIWETAQGLMNSIGLENPGVASFIAEKLPEMMVLGPVVIANLSGSDLESYVAGARLLDQTAVPMIELNISCPNVKAGGMAFGMDPGAAREVVAAVREATSKPLMVKLTPNAPDLTRVARAVCLAGADALSLVNTFQGMAIDVKRARPVFANVKAGLSGPAIKPLALRMVYDVVQMMSELPAESQIPVVGLGGIATWRDAAEFLLAGATAVQVGTATFANPRAAVEIVDGLTDYLRRIGIADLAGLRARFAVE